MQNRIRILRKRLGLNQTEFGEKIGVKGNTITNYECGNRIPMDSTILSICRTFHVNEQWLRTGEGEMFVAVSREAEIAELITGACRREPGESREYVIKTVTEALSKLNDAEIMALAEIVKKMI